MSTLTKVFVVLLVVLSLVMSAGLVVFINRQQPFKADNERLSKELDVQRQLASVANDQVAKEKAQAAAIVTEQNKEITSLQNAVADAQSKVGDLNVKFAGVQQNLTLQIAANTSASQALTIAQDSITRQNANIAALQTANDKLRGQSVDDNTRITDLTQALNVATRHGKYAEEQVAQLQQQVSSQGELLRKYNISPAGRNDQGAINDVPSVNINGVVRDYSKINGVPYATISLGSADAVRRGMKFRVIDPTHNQWLGYLTVDSVQAHDATGHVEGPGVDRIQANVSEVRTQL